MLKKKLTDFNSIFDLFNNNWAILTAGGKTYNAMTVSWGQIGVLWNKNVATVYVRPNRYTNEFISVHDSFSLSFLPIEYKKELTVFGTKTGREMDKFKETGLTPVYDVDMDITYVKEAKYVLKMKKIYVGRITPEGMLDNSIMKNYPNPDYHYVYIGEIKQFLVVGEE